MPMLSVGVSMKQLLMHAMLKTQVVSTVKIYSLTKKNK